MSPTHPPTPATNRLGVWGGSSTIFRETAAMVRDAAITARAGFLGPVRRRRLDRLAAAGTAPPMVVFYHRVADTHPNDWTISRSGFTDHLDRIAQTHAVVDLARVQSLIRGRQPATTRPPIAITFDDGYAENAEFALPELIARRWPVTYFVATGHVESGNPFEHDRSQPLAIDSPAELRRLADSGIEIGGHTRDHVDCQTQSPDQLKTQIADDKDRLEQIIGRPVRYFAFPFGTPAQLSAAAIRVVARAGYQGYCSAFGGYNTVGGDAAHIRRFHGDPDMRRFENWLSFDPRKLNEPPTPRPGGDLFPGPTP